MSVWTQKPMFKEFYQKNTRIFLKTQCFQKIRKTRCFSQGTTFLQVLEALGIAKKPTTNLELKFRPFHTQVCLTRYDPGLAGRSYLLRSWRVTKKAVRPRWHVLAARFSVFRAGVGFFLELSMLLDCLTMMAWVMNAPQLACARNPPAYFV